MRTAAICSTRLPTTKKTGLRGLRSTRNELKKLLALAITKMPEVEKTVLGLYYHEELTLREISKILHLHESRISQLKSQAILRLRAYMEKRWPKPRGI